jgi:hypothetical protein
MTRSGYRNVMLLLVVFFTGVERQNNLTRLGQEFENANRLNIALNELDGLTVNEQTATQLDILRHLGLEQSELEFRMESREVRSVGNTGLYVHNVRLGGSLPYPAALYLADRLQNTKKIMISSIVLTPVNDGPNRVAFTLTGRIYGLDKNDRTAVPAQ